LTYVTKKRTR
ncbi:hypothetical protein VCHENC02_2010B, partial [Vibrio harveyi]